MCVVFIIACLSGVVYPEQTPLELVYLPLCCDSSSPPLVQEAVGLKKYSHSSSLEGLGS